MSLLSDIFEMSENRIWKALADTTRREIMAYLAERWDRGYGHFTTRQNIQFNWPKLVDIPDMLDHLAAVQMHAIQTSGNCIRNVTSDPFAGVAGDEWIDPRPTAELLRQWSSLHPEFAYLPRKFKFAVSGAAEDRTALKFHDIGLKVKPSKTEDPIYEIWVGGGQGRTPKIAVLFEDNVPLKDLLPKLDSMLRVYNLHGRRDNKYKARIKILVSEYGIENYRRDVEEDLALQSLAPFAPAVAEYHRIAQNFIYSETKPLAAIAQDNQSEDLRNWIEHNVSSHKVPGYAVVSISLKPKGGIPGDATATQMYHLADLAERYSASELRITHRQNVVLPNVPADELAALYEELLAHGLAEDNIGQLSDIIACPGLDYCALATARSIPVAQALSERLREREKTEDLAGLSLNISGCINACGHHHAASIGILGLNRAEVENYQVTLGGSSSDNASVGEILGPGFDQEEIPGVVDRILDFYQSSKQSGETFNQTYQRLGKSAFKEAVYVAA